VLDPPSFSTTRAGRFEVKRDYARLVTAALGVLEPGGALLACVNHHGLGQGWLVEQVQRAAKAAGRVVAQVTSFEPPADFRTEAGQAAPSKSVLLVCS
jgi:23S rRNA (cytosine1962-C5)-methyltransferase